MKWNKFNYISLIILHVLIGATLFVSDFLSKLYFVIIIFFFLFRIFKANKNKRPTEVIMACGYIIGVEVFLRMTGGAFLYEASKYTVIMFLIIGIAFNNISIKSYPYLIYILLLVPGIIIAAVELNYETVFRKAIAFNLSGPVCLGIAALYCYQRKIPAVNLNEISQAIVLPLIANTVYLFLYNPDIKDVLSGTQSNFEASGGFGPNQVATVLGMGMLFLVVRYIVFSPNMLHKIINLSLLTLVSYRAIITFSRGGVLSAIVVIIFFLSIYFMHVSGKRKKQLSVSITVIIIAALGIWIYTSVQTLGFIDKRYTNKDAAGRIKDDVTTGRVELIANEFQEFFNNPFLGTGVGKIKELRAESTGITVASHNEMSRILAEHGVFGVFAFLILLVAPLVLRIRNKKNYLFYSCYLFWFLTINHSSMRIAAPAFIYALCLLDIQHDKPIVHRKQIS